MTELTGARWSAAVRCPLQGAYTALNEPAADHPEQVQRYFARGRLFEHYVITQLEARHGRENVVRQLVIPWGPEGRWQGHADALVRDSDGKHTLIEVVSTTAPNSGIYEQKLRQLRGYWHFAERSDAWEIDGGALYVIDPSDLRREDAIPVYLRDEHRREVEALEAVIADAVLEPDRPLPDCSMPHPTACRFNCCDYTDLAWADWQPEPAGELEATEELLEELSEWVRAAEAHRHGKRTLEAAKQQRQAIEERLIREHGLGLGETTVAGYKIKRWHVGGRETVAIKKARDAGLWTDALDEMLGPFVSLSDGYDRVQIERTEGRAAVPVVDYGDEAPF